MKYIVFDLEFNQGFDRVLNKTVSNEKCPFEILQIGAVKLDSNFNIINTFNSYVKPQIYNGIHPYVKKMTGISKSDVSNAPYFIDVYNQFSNFIEDDDSVFCVWGVNDLKEIYRNIMYHNLDPNPLPKKYINVQQYASKHFNNPPGKSIGLQNAIELLNLSEDKSYHDALNDAYYTALVFINIKSSSMVPQTYTYKVSKSLKSSSIAKSNTNYDNLFNEFKKVLNRDLTKEDKKIINLAYNMGRKCQFSSDVSIKMTKKKH